MEVCQTAAHTKWRNEVPKEVQTPYVNHCEHQFVHIRTDKVLEVHSKVRIRTQFVHISEVLAEKYVGSEGW